MGKAEEEELSCLVTFNEKKKKPRIVDASVVRSKNMEEVSI